MTEDMFRNIREWGTVFENTLYILPHNSCMLGIYISLAMFVDNFTKIYPFFWKFGRVESDSSEFSEILPAPPPKTLFRQKHLYILNLHVITHLPKEFH